MTTTRHISLRAMEPEDLELIYRLENDPDIWRWGTTTVPYSRFAVRQYLEQNQNDLFADRQLRLVAVDEVTGLPVGLADLFNFDPLHRRAEIGLLIVPDFRSKGLSHTILRQLEAYAERVSMHQLYATIATANIPATRLFQKAGYGATAQLKDWLLLDGRWVDAAVWQKTFL